MPDCDLSTGTCPYCHRPNPTANRALRRNCTAGGIVVPLGPAPSRSAIGGPGTELAAILTAAGAGECSACELRAAQMDAWGVDGCRANRATICGWLAQAAIRAPWGEAIRSGSYLRRQPWFQTCDPFGSLVDEAIRRGDVTQKGRSP